MADGRLLLVFCGLLAVVGVACAAPPPAQDPGLAHPGESWFPVRAAQLGIPEDQARERDAALSTEAPPHAVWDDDTRREARALWRDLCAECHGAAGRLEGVTLPEGQEPPRDWGGMGAAMGFLMGGDAMRAGVYRRIARGGDREGRPSEMPAWEDRLAREQIWSLVFLLETF